MNNDISSFIAGYFTGLCEVIIGHPLNTITTHYQNCGGIMNLKLRHLYAGCTYPFISNGIIISFEFGVFEYFRRREYSITVSAMLSGTATSIVMAPVDRFKIKRQLLNKTNIYNRPFKGIQYVFAREIPATAIYFNSYYYYREKTSVITAGGMSGLTTWTVTYPLDVIKTRMQSDSYKSLKEAILAKNLYKGITPCLLRSVCVNSVSFYVYEYVIELLNN